MGAAVSRQVVTSVTQSFVNIVASTSIQSQKQCSGQAFSSQQVTIVSITNSKIDNITLDASQQISTTCIQSNTSNNTLSNDLTTQLQNTASQAVKQNGLTLGANVSSSDINQVNQAIADFSLSFSVNNLSTCIANVVNQQDLNIGTVTGSTIGNISLAIDQSVIAKCVQEDDSFNAMNNTVATTLSNVAQQSVSQGIDLFSGLIVLVIIVVVIYLVYKQGISFVAKPQVIIAITAIICVLIGIRFL